MTEKKTPAYTFGVPYKHNYETDGPGPNAYTARPDWSRNTKGALIGSRSSDFRVWLRGLIHPINLLCTVSVIYHTSDNVSSFECQRKNFSVKILRIFILAERERKRNLSDKCLF